MDFTNRLRIPQSEDSLLRYTLFERLDQTFTRALVSVVAGGGYGKTTLVADFLRHRDIPSLWFPFHTLSGGFSSFIELLAKGLYHKEPQITLPAGEIDLLEVLAHWREPLAIVLDDYHLVESTEFSGFLLQLVQHCSSSVNIVVISRERPPFPYAKLKIQHKLAEWTEKDFEFSAQETSKYFQLNGISMADHELNLLQLKTSGWPASLPLVLEAWKGVNPENRRWDWRLFPFTALFEELEPELLNTTGAEFLSDLPLTSILHEWDDRMVSSFLPDYPLEWLNERVKQRFFVRRHQDGKSSYLPLFRMYLYEKLIETKGKQEVRVFHLRAAKIYETEYQYYFAFAHYLAANSYGDAARIMQKMMNLYTPERFILLLDGSLEAICPSISMALFSHFLFRSVPVAILGSYIEPLKQTMNRLKNKGLSTALVYLEHRLGIILFYSGDIEGARALFLSSFEGSQLLGHSDLVSVNLALAAQCCRFTGQLEEGVAFARKALTNIELGAAQDSRMHATWVLTELLLEQNELARAKPFVEELQRLSNDYDDEGARVYPLIAIGKYYRLTGDIDKALTFTNLGMTEAEKLQLDADLGWGYLELGFIYWKKADLRKAEECLQKSLNYFAPYSYFSSLVNQTLQIVTNTAAGNPSSSEIKIHENTDKLSIQLFGEFKLQYGDTQITVNRKSSLRLLMYLAVHYQQKIPKEILLEELLPEGNYTSQNNRFYVSLSTLRKALEPALAQARLSKYIIQTGELFFLDKNQCDIDLEKFQRLISRVDSQSPEERIEDLKKAADLYHGDLLAEYPYEPFLDSIRETTKQKFLQVLQELGQYFWRQQDFKQGQYYYDRALLHDQYTESIYWEYIHLLVNNGMMSYAKQIGSKMEKFIEGELGIPVKEKLWMIFGT